MRKVPDTHFPIAGKHRQSCSRAVWIGLVCLLAVASLSACDAGPQPAATLATEPTVTTTPTSRSAPEPTATPAPQLEELRRLALELINRDRADHDLPPVLLGSNPAAQLHAEDMLEHNYQGHWWADGRKPYMVYSQTGGTSYVAENAASGGWTDQEWEEASCGSLLVSCSVPHPATAISELQRLMMYDDADADWGHRDNILGKSHRAVNIGIATNRKRVTFVQHFEGGAAVALASPTLSTDNRLSFEVAKQEPEMSIGGVVSIYYDPLPIPRTPEQIDRLDSYCLGGGFTTQCGEPVARVLRPLPPEPGYSYVRPRGQ